MRALLLIAVVLLSSACDVCRTACDCKPGYACHEGKCSSGTVAVFCCGVCPTGATATQSCQRANGTFSVCGPR